MPPDAASPSHSSSWSQGFAFAGAVRCEPRGPDSVRLIGPVQDGAVIVDLFSSGAAAQALRSLAAEPLLDVVLSRPAGPAGDWSLAIAGRSVALPQLRVFVHRDVVARVSTAIPPRPVPWKKRLFWSALLLLLRTSPGRRWVRQRYGSE